MSIQKTFIVRYRAEGHVRFQVSDQLTDARVANRVIDKVAQLEGVYRVFLFRSNKKLSIRYHETVCDLPKLARDLFALIDTMEKQGLLDPEYQQEQSVSVKSKAAEKIKKLPVSRWFNRKYTDVQETMKAAKIITKLGLKKPNALIKDPEKTIVDFLNDVLVLYLIKLHWTRITQEWLLKPITHRYEWMAVFYLFYLLVRSRRPKD